MRTEFCVWSKGENGMKKRIIILLSTLTLVLGSGATVHAEDYEGESGWSVRFVGNGMESNFKTADINDAIYNLQPGDSVGMYVTLENAGGKYTDWWMTNKVLRSLEDTQEVAAGGGYSYVLSYTDPSGEVQTLYSSDTVGGEKDSESGEGLREATDSLEEYFYLDTLKSGEKGMIYLKVSLDGETQGNSYQDTLADLQMNFAVEETAASLIPVDDGGEPGGPSGGQTPSSGTDGNADDAGTSGARGTRTPPRTSDESALLPYVVLSLGSGIGLLILALYSMKHSRKEQKGGVEG